MASRHPTQLDAPTTTRPSHGSKRQPTPLHQLLPLAPLVQRAAQSPAALSPAEVLQLHRTLGNRAVGQLIQGHLSRQARGASPSPVGMIVQPKLLLGPVGDRYEQEADRVAQQVVQQLDAEPLRAAVPAVQRRADEVADQRLESESRLSGGIEVGGDLEGAIRHARAGGQPLEDGLHSQMEQGFGAHFDDVRVHNDSQSHLLNRAVGSEAFTVGAHIFLGANHSQHETPLVAHELAHTIQQGASAPIAGHKQVVTGQPSHGEVNRMQRKVYVGGDQKEVRWPADSGSPIDRLIGEISAKKESALLSYLLEALPSDEKHIYLDSLSFDDLQSAAHIAGIVSQSTDDITKIKKPKKEKKAYKDIPNIIHFIWAGGAKLLPDKNTQVIKSWMAANPDSRVYLWIDQETAPEGVNLKAYYQQQFADAVGGKFTVMDIVEHGVVRPHSRYEIDRMRPNYGASSDLLRYRILDKFGGAYFDSDVEPGTMSVSEVIQQAKKQKTGFLVTGYTQGIEAVGNDAYLAAKGSPYMKALAETAEKRYAMQFGGTEATIFDEADIIKASTIWRTGPEASSQMLYEQGLLKPLGNVHGKATVRPEGAKTEYLNQPPENMTLPRNLVRQLGQGESPDTNDRSWLGMPVKATKNLQAAWSIVEKSIKFEVEVMGQLRLRTHLSNMIESVERGTKRKIQEPFHEVLWFVVCELMEAYNNRRIDFSTVMLSDSPKKTTELTAYLIELVKRPSLW